MKTKQRELQQPFFGTNGPAEKESHKKRQRKESTDMIDKEALELFEKLTPEAQDLIIEMMEEIIANRDSTPDPEREGGC